MKYIFTLLLTNIFLLLSAPTYADNYFKSLDKIMAPSQEATSILACDINEKKKVVALLQRDDKVNFKNVPLNVDEYGTISGQDMSVSYELMKGDFSNEGLTEYALITTSGTGNYNSVIVYKLINDHLVDAKLDDLISRDLLHGKEVGPHFYGYTARPFAVIKNGKTYLRYMRFPSARNYDKSQLMLCTYVWNKDKLSLSGPNFTFSKANGKLIPAKNCIR